MTRVYQRIDDPKIGDCFKCCVASILDLGYDDVPNLIEYEDNWIEETQKFFRKYDYDYTGTELYNPNLLFLENPLNNVYKDVEIDERLTFKNMKISESINGLFIAVVYSPKYTDPNQHPISHLHCVLCDKDLNIVFDPQKNYETVINYPYSKLIGFNGIRSVDIIKKIDD